MKCRLPALISDVASTISEYSVTGRADPRAVDFKVMFDAKVTGRW